MYKVGLYTLGCKVSLYETEAIGEAFEREGFSVCSFDDVCDVYVINTCTVTAESDAKSRKYIRRAIRKNPNAVVIVIGCYSQRAPDEVARIEGVSAVIGTADKMKAVEVAKQFLNAECRMQNVSSQKQLITDFDVANAQKQGADRAECIEERDATMFQELMQSAECRIQN